MNPLLIAKLWLLIRPIDKIRLLRAQRKAHRAGLPEPTSLSDGGVVFPQGTMTKSGIVLMALSGIITSALTLIGIGNCSPDELAQGCVTASQVVPPIIQGLGLLGGAIGSVVAWKGRNRATKVLTPQ